MDVIDRLVAAVEASGLKRIRIAETAGIIPTKLSKIVNRKQVPSVVEFIDIARAIGVDPALLVSDGELVIELEKLREAYAASQRVHEVLASWLPEAAPARPSRLEFPKREASREVTPVGAAANPNAELIAEYEVERKSIPRRAWDRDARIIARVHGDSMDGGADPIRDGELAYLKPTRSPRKAIGHVVLVRRDDGLYLKKFEKSGHAIRLVSMNGEPPLVLDARAENMQIYGYVVDHGREK